MGFSYQVIVLFVILGAAGAVLLGWAATHVFHTKPPSPHGDYTAGTEFNQAVYMREVRLRHQEHLAASSQGGKRALVS